MKEEFALVNGVKICYEIQGKGDPIVLIHGFGVTKEEWIGQFEPLSQYFKVVRFDNRGSGKSDRPNTPYTMELFADDTRGLMDFLEIKKAHIIGWSVGGMIAQHFAIKYPERVNKLILINTTAAWPEEKSGLELYKNAQVARYEARLNDPVKTFFDAAKMGFSRNFLKLMKEDPEKKFYGLFSAEDLIKKSTINPAKPQDIANQAHALGTHNVLDRLHLINSETKIICAEKDRQMPKSVNLKIHEGIPNSEYIVIEGVGHSSPQEKAPEINKMIIEFLKK
ncbi:MAG: alpha/beta hydrolase [Candidatus Lokiarchaeota archaeon]|nr:alpha/beta hydrolase [Candidatus Lokiarchaeota archaeon]